jgi:hypothetical protein
MPTPAQARSQPRILPVSRPHRRQRTRTLPHAQRRHRHPEARAGANAVPPCVFRSVTAARSNICILGRSIDSSQPRVQKRGAAARFKHACFLAGTWAPAPPVCSRSGGRKFRNLGKCARVGREEEGTSSNRFEFPTLEGLY